MRRILAAAAMAVAAVTTLGLTWPGAAGAGTSRQATTAHIGKTYAKGSGGYQLGGFTGSGWRFRHIKTTLTVPACTSRATNASMELWSEEDAVTFSVKCGGGPDSIRYWISYWDDAKSLDLQPSAGDRVTISIYQDPRKGVRSTTFTAVDLTTGSKATAVEGFYRYDFILASITGGGPRWDLASSDTRLWAFKDTRLTSRHGTHGTLLGPWPTARVIGTRGGTSAGAVVLWPTYPWNDGHNFSIWWRAAS